MRELFKKIRIIQRHLGERIDKKKDILIDKERTIEYLSLQARVKFENFKSNGQCDDNDDSKTR